MSETLRPSTLGEILDRTVQLYRRNFLLFAGVASLPMGTLLAFGAIGGGLFGLAAVAARGTPLSDAFAGIVLALFLAVALPVYLAAGVFSCAGLTQAAVSTHRGEMLTIRAALKSVTPRFWTYLGFLLLEFIFAVAIPGAIFGSVFAVLIYLASQAGLGAAAGLGFLAFLVAVMGVVVIIWCALSLAIGLPVCVVELKGPWTSLERAWKLSKGTRGRIFVLILLIIVLDIAASMIAAIPFMIILGVIAVSGNEAAHATALVVAEIVRVVVDFALQVLLTPFSWIALVLFYYDQRIRKEGFDIEWMMEQAGLVPPVPATPPADFTGISGPAPFAPAAAPDPNAGISSPVAPPDTVEGR